MRFQRRDGVSVVSAITCYSSAMRQSRRARAVVRALAWTSSMLAAAIVAAQTPGVHPISGRRFAPVMGYQGADWLERAEREDEEAPDVASHVPTSWHSSMAAHTTGLPPTQVPPEQVSAWVQALPSSQAVPSALVG